MSDAAPEAALAAAAQAIGERFDAVIELAPNDAKPLWINGGSSPVKIAMKKPPTPQATCAWRGPKDILASVLAGERALESAYISGRFSIAGDMSVMARLKLKGIR